ncbi:MAG: DUF4433 domain-containing protein [Bacteroidales bacterium]|jgi:hypothetical protein|nr:DUF4433 domain-containing protein [Bacteroidales bacterium]
MDLSDLKIFRMTHIENIPHILQYGITNRYSINANPNYKNIGDISLIDYRKDKQIQIDNGLGKNENNKKITLGDFIPFYFWYKMPMLYVIKNGGNFVPKATKSEEIIYLVCGVKQIINDKTVEYYFSDGHPVGFLSSLYDCSKINDLITIVDWKSIKENNWGGVDNRDLKRKKAAEFLVKDDIPTQYILHYICYNENTKSRLENMKIDSSKIDVNPEAYY